MKNIVEVIQSETRGYVGKLAFVDGNRMITYAELLARTSEVSVELKKLAIKVGNRVALLCEDSIDYVILSLAVLKLSAVIVPIPFTSSKEEIEAVLREMKINFFIFEKGVYVSHKAKRLKIKCGLDKKFLVLWRP